MGLRSCIRVIRLGGIRSGGSGIEELVGKEVHV